MSTSLSAQVLQNRDTTDDNNKNKNNSNNAINSTDSGDQDAAAAGYGVGGDGDGVPELDDEQIVEYTEMIEELGSFPDKVSINSLSMIAEDYSDAPVSARAIYNIIRKRLLNPSTYKENILPLVYVLDSILKNAKGQYIGIVENDAENWIPVIFNRLQESQRLKLQKVWKTWREFRLFKAESLQVMGKCFESMSSSSSSGGAPGGTEDTTKISASSTASAGNASITGIGRAKDGSLLLSSELRHEMQTILDEVQSDVQDELEKVSLERLADLNPSMLNTIKQTAEENLRSANEDHSSTMAIDLTDSRSPSQSTSTSTAKPKVKAPSRPAFLQETRAQSLIERSQAWAALEWNKKYEDQTKEMVAKLMKRVEDDTSDEKRYTQQEAIQQTQYLAAVTATANLLSNTIDRIRAQEKRAATASENANKFLNPDGSIRSASTFKVDKALFTNDGLKKKSDAVIGQLYEIGLPFVSSADGRRFASQLDLSKHLDALFKKNQLTKTIACSEERGWYAPDIVWTRDVSEEELQKMGTSTIMTSEPLADYNSTSGKESGAANDDYDPQTSTVPADETRERCVICGIKFRMQIDNDEGVYVYSNCREITVMNDDAAEVESEDLLVHVTCWRGLGSPEELTADQTLQF